jgi:hypothetical protein
MNAAWRILHIPNCAEYQPLLVVAVQVFFSTLCHIGLYVFNQWMDWWMCFGFAIDQLI